MATKAELEVELAALKATHEQLKADVVRVAKEKAESHGWCSVVNDALNELGLGEPQIKVTLTILDPRRLHEIANDKADYGLSELLRPDGTVNKHAVTAAIQWAIEGIDHEDVVEPDFDSVELVKDA